MKISKDGKIVKNAKVIYTTGGQPSMVEVDGVYYDARAYELEDDKATKQTKPAETKTKQTAKAPKKGLKNRLSSVLSTKDV